MHTRVHMYAHTGIPKQKVMSVDGDLKKEEEAEQKVQADFLKKKRKRK